MRVIGGEFRSRGLTAPAGVGTRPSSDRLRETLFSVLQSSGKVSDCFFADLFAGSGAVGIEALSRGAAHCFFIESAMPALTAIRKNLKALGIGAGRATVFAGEAAKFQNKWPRACDVIFLDPSYEDAAAYSRTLRALGGELGAIALAEGALVIAEHAAPKTRKGVEDLADEYGGLKRVRLLKQSDAALSFYSRSGI